MSLVDFGSCPSLSPLLWVWGAGKAPVAGAGAEVRGEGRGGPGREGPPPEQHGSLGGFGA